MYIKIVDAATLGLFYREAGDSVGA